VWEFDLFLATRVMHESCTLGEALSVLAALFYIYIYKKTSRKECYINLYVMPFLNFNVTFF